MKIKQRFPDSIFLLNYIGQYFLLSNSVITKVADGNEIVLKHIEDLVRFEGDTEVVSDYTNLKFVSDIKWYLISEAKLKNIEKYINCSNMIIHLNSELKR